MANSANRINLSDFFKGDSLSRIRTYVTNLQKYVDEYDLLVLMARKAICFFDALVRNKEISLEGCKCRIITNRIFTYNISEISDKKIIILDDIVVRGKTLRETIGKIENYTKNFKIYFLANKDNSDNLKDILKDDRLLTIPSELVDKDVLTLSNSISNYITASMCSLNIDYPVFNSSISQEDFNLLKSKLSCFKIGNSIQDCFDIDVCVQSITSKLQTKIFSAIDSNSLVMKIRFFYDKNRNEKNLVMIPIVLFEKVSYSLLENLFEKCSDKNICSMVKHPDHILENKFKWVQFFVAYKLFGEAVKQIGFISSDKVIYDTFKQNWILPYKYEKEINTLLNSVREFPVINTESPCFNTFDVSDIYVRFNNFLMKVHESCNDHEKTKFAYEDVLNNCRSENIKENAYSRIMSIIFDVAIDKGLIVPFTTVDDENKVVYRAYRLSEQFELTIKHQEFFLKMLSYFSEYSGTSYLDKTVVEKLMVIFFNKVIKNEAVEKRAGFGANLFSIHYTRFGPVVSSGESIYEVDEGNELSHKITSNSEIYEFKKLRFDRRKRKYEVPVVSEIDISEDWNNKAAFFGEEYYALSQIFNKVVRGINIPDNFNQIRKKHIEKNNRIRSFGKYLVLKAIGQKQEDRYLSLLAELQLFKNFYNKYNSSLKGIFYSLTGLVSGAWKYLCYKEKSQKKIERIIEQYFYCVQEENNDIDAKVQHYQKWINTTKAILNNRPQDSKSFDITDISQRINYIKKISQSLKRELPSCFNGTELDEKSLEFEKNLYNDYLLQIYERLNTLRDTKENNNQDLAKQPQCKRALTFELNTEEEQFQKKLEEKITYAASLICELLQCWNLIKAIDAEDYERFKEQILSKKGGQETLKEVSPDDPNASYIKDLKKYTGTVDLKLNSLEEITEKLDDICKITNMLVSEYDVCIKDDLVSKPFGAVVVLHKLCGEKSRLFSEIKEENLNLEKFLDIDYDDKTTCAFELVNKNVKLLSDLTNESNMTKIIYRFSKKYNTCYMNAHGEGVLNEFIKIFKNTYPKLRDTGKIYNVSDNNEIDSDKNLNCDCSKDVRVTEIDSVAVSQICGKISGETIMQGKSYITKHDDYSDIRIGIITALEEEFASVSSLLQNVKECKNINQKGEAGNRFYIGEIKALDGGTHRVVLTMLPKMGNDFASIIATKLHVYFPSINNFIVCGIAGGVPKSVGLGDVVVSTSGVIEYDYGADKVDEFVCKEPPSECGAFLLQSVKYLIAHELRYGESWSKKLQQIINLMKADFSRPLREGVHFELNEQKKYIEVETPTKVKSQIFYGKIASGNAVEKNHIKRDRLAQKHEIIAIEMESGGVNHSTQSSLGGYIAIRGICDYCDEHKNNAWHNYAAAVAAAYTYTLIESIPSTNK